VASICTDEIDGHVHHLDAPLSGHFEDKNTERIHHLLHHLHNYQRVSGRRTQLLVYMLLTLMYFAITMTLLGANCL
jgi:hypothetical protein